MPTASIPFRSSARLRPARRPLEGGRPMSVIRNLRWLLVLAPIMGVATIAAAIHGLTLPLVALLFDRWGLEADLVGLNARPAPAGFCCSARSSRPSSCASDFRGSWPRQSFSPPRARVMAAAFPDDRRLVSAQGAPRPQFVGDLGRRRALDQPEGRRCPPAAAPSACSPCSTGSASPADPASSALPASKVPGRSWPALPSWPAPFS